MSYCVTYCLWLKGTKFNTLLPKNLCATDEEIKEFVKEDIRLDIEFPGSGGVEVLAEVTGEITILWTPWVYSLLLSNSKEVQQTITNFEALLKSKFPEVLIMRIDELLLEQWTTEVGEYWFRKKDDCSKLLEWIQTQDKRHWNKANSPKLHVIIKRPVIEQTPLTPTLVYREERGRYKC